MVEIFDHVVRHAWLRVLDVDLCMWVQRLLVSFCDPHLQVRMAPLVSRVFKREYTVSFAVHWIRLDLSLSRDPMLAFPSIRIIAEVGILTVRLMRLRILHDVNFATRWPTICEYILSQRPECWPHAFSYQTFLLTTDLDPGSQAPETKLERSLYGPRSQCTMRRMTMPIWGARHVFAFLTIFAKGPQNELSMLTERILLLASVSLRFAVL